MTIPRLNFVSMSNFKTRLDEIIEKNLFNEDFSVEELARLLHLSSSQVYWKIKRKEGISTSVYIRNKRLECAYNLMMETDWTISQIALSLTFYDVAYFSKCFSCFYGDLPSRIRKRNQ